MIDYQEKAKRLRRTVKSLRRDWRKDRDRLLNRIHRLSALVECEMTLPTNQELDYGTCYCGICEEKRQTEGR